MACKHFPSLRGRFSISRKRINILVVNDSTSKGNEPSKLIVGGKNRRTKFEERENACEEIRIERSGFSTTFPLSLVKRKMERGE